MIHHTCFKCGRRMELDPIMVGIELGQLKTKNPKFYQAHCPACQSVNKVSVVQMQEELNAVAAEVAPRLEEIKKAQAEAKAAKRAVTAKR